VSEGRSGISWPPEVLAIAAATARADDTFLVGGVVRDVLLRRPIRDIDLVTSQSGIAIARRLANHFGGDVYVLDAERDIGRALVTISGVPIKVDVSSLRGPDLEADLRDRDFTINAIAVPVSDIRAAPIDPCGGLSDLRAKRVRMCSPDSISRDAVRALRAVRYSVQFSFRLEPDVIAACRAADTALAKVSGERLRDEWFRLLAIQRARLTMTVLDSLHLLEGVIPEGSALWKQERVDLLQRMERIEQFAAVVAPTRTDETAANFALGMFVMALDRFRRPLHAHLNQVWPDDRLHLSILLHTALLVNASAAELEQSADRLRLSGAERRRLLTAQLASRRFPSVDVKDALSVMHFWRDTGDAGIDGILLALASVRIDGQSDADAWLAHLERARLALLAWLEQRDVAVSPPALVDGSILQAKFARGPGRWIGATLQHIQEQQVLGHVSTPEQALHAAMDFLSAGAYDGEP